MRRALCACLALTGSVWLALLAGSATAKVLRVGTYHHIRGQYRTVQAAVDHARPGDWILIGPGDYKTTSSRMPSGPSSMPKFPAAVLITTPRLHLRGMNRNRVVIDGTTQGRQCNALKADQNFGPADGSGGHLGLNGVEVFKANRVSVENLTTCNFLSGSGDAGNGIWWNGGAESGQIGGWGFYGAYITSTSSYYDPNNTSTAAAYGIFSSNWDGGTWYNAYASNFNDSGYYIGACQQECNQTMNDVWAQYNALGYSGSNSGGQLVVKNSEFDHNEDGFDTNSQNGDNPPPQNGACPNNGISPITHTHSCWVFMHNRVHDNNNPNIPSAGLAAAGPVGTGMSLSGARNDTVMDNVFYNNKAWGTIVVPFPDSGPPCTGGTSADGQGNPVCLYDEFGDAILNNTYYDNGGYGNPSNGDIGWASAEPDPTPCFSGNRDTKGPLTTAPSNLQKNYPTCNGKTVPPDPGSSVFLEEVGCDSTLVISGTTKLPCAPTDHYPRRTTVTMPPLPKHLQTMRNPCQGVPANPWCPAKRSRRKHARHRR